MKFSAYQEAIFDWIQSGSGDAVAEAVAGSGKTTTIVEGSNRVLGGPVLFVAFNKRIVETLQSKLGSSAEAKTINSIGHGTLCRHLGRVTLNDSKYRDIIYQATPQLPQGCDHTEVRNAIYELVSFAHTSYTHINDLNDDGLMDLVAHYGIDFPNGSDMLTPEWYCQMVRDAIQEGIEIAKEQYVISYNDQIWLPNVWNLKPKQYPFVMVDEAQDLSKGKLALILGCRAPGGRFLFVGDPAQSCYGFAGADPAAWVHIIEHTNAQILPLSVCYRCPTSHIELAQKFVPQIEAAEGAIKGIVRTIEHEALFGEVQTNDLILCRTTAPLIRACLQLIARKQPARVIGRDLGKSLVALAKEGAKLRKLDEFPIGLEEACAHRAKKFAGRKNAEAQLRALDDRREGLLACYDAMDPTSYADFYDQINGLFSQDRAVITLSSIHRAKGLENDRVFILRPDLLSKFGKQDWEQVQERNLHYVAVTRAKHELIFVTKEKEQ